MCTEFLCYWRAANRPKQPSYLHGKNNQLITLERRYRETASTGFNSE
jgi:hypothetical protein